MLDNITAFGLQNHFLFFLDRLAIIFLFLVVNLIPVIRDCIPSDIFTLKPV